MSHQGFTLVELVLVIGMTATVAAIVIPRMGHALRHAQEARTKGNLGALRAAIGVYSATHEGNYPTDTLECLVKEGYLKEIPMAYYPSYHPEGNDVDTGAINAMTDSTEAWFWCKYDKLPDKYNNQLFANCNHKTLNGKRWNQL